MSNPSYSRIAKNYEQAIAYLDHCGPFSEQHLREANRIAGAILTEIDIQKLIRSAPLMISSGGKRGGMEGVKDEFRNVLVQGVVQFGMLARTGRKLAIRWGCLAPIGISSILAYGVYWWAFVRTAPISIAWYLLAAGLTFMLAGWILMDRTFNRQSQRIVAATFARDSEALSESMSSIDGSFILAYALGVILFAIGGIWLAVRAIM